MSTDLKSEPSATDSHPAASTCPNCGASAGGNFCHHCGQETVLHPASAREFLHEFVGHYVALEGRLVGTVGRLLFRPGALTNEYIKGRRVRFVQPLRLYLTLSVLFFALMQWTHSFDLHFGDKDTVDGKPAVVAGAPGQGAKPPSAAPSTPQAKPGRDAPGALLIDDPDDDDLELNGDTVEHWLAGWPRLRAEWNKARHMSREQSGKAFSQGIYHYAPYALFCMMPFFALYLKVLYLGSGRRFGEHLLFALHANAFAFVMFMCLIALPLPGLLRFALWIWLLAYLPWAMRRVYLGSRFGTAWRWLTLMFFYMFTLLIAFVIAIGAGVVTAGH